MFSGEGAEGSIGAHLAEAGSEAVGQGGLGEVGGDGEVQLDTVLGEETFAQGEAGRRGRGKEMAG